MNIKRTLLAALAVFTLGAGAQAVTVVRITGSTAFRASAVSAIENYIGVTNLTGAFIGGTSGQFNAASLGTGSNECGATYAVLAGNGYVFELCWTGSIGGVITDVYQYPISAISSTTVYGWLSSTNIPNTVVAGGASAIAQLGSTFTASTFGDGGTPPPDANFSDSQQSTTGYTAKTLTGAGTDGEAGQIGVIPFEYVLGNCNTTNGTAGTVPAISNVTSLQAQALLAGGVQLSIMDGVAADTGKIVYMAGRNFDSGTRLSEFVESGFGFETQPQQVSLTLNSSSNAVTTLGLYPPDTLYGPTTALTPNSELTYAPGQSGYSSGGTLAKALEAAGSITAAHPPSGNPDLRTVYQKGAHAISGGYVIAYLGYSDAQTAILTGTGQVDTANTAKTLSYDGVSIQSGGSGAAINATPIQEGQYHGWEYEYLYYNPAITSTDPRATALNAIADALFSSTSNTPSAANGYAGVSGIAIGTMDVNKTVEGGVITHN